MQKCSRFSAASEILDTIDDTTIPADKVMATWGRHNRYAGSKDRGAVAQLVYGVLRNRNRLNWWIRSADMHPCNRTRLITYLVFDKQDITEFFDSEVQFSQRDLTSKEREFSAFIVNQDSMTHAEMPDYIQWDMQEWLADKIKIALGDSVEQESLAFNSEAPVDVRVNTLKSDMDAVLKAFEKESIAVQKCKVASQGIRLDTRVPLSGLEMFRQGWIEVQDEGSQIVSQLVNAKRGDKIVDFCAGAGGKTLSLAAAMENTGRIICCDVSEKRLDRAGIRFRRAGVNNAERRTLTSEKDKWVKRRAGRFDGGFDKVVVDAPCTGTGTWRRNPDQKWRTTEQTLADLVKLQSSILQSASRLVRKGGRLIYITCSILQEENEQQIENFLKENKEFHQVNMQDVWRDAFDADCPNAGKDLRLTPYKNSTDGFYIAIIERKF